jgi:hypothetical protein
MKISQTKKENHKKKHKKITLLSHTTRNKIWYPWNKSQHLNSKSGIHGEQNIRLQGNKHITIRAAIIVRRNKSSQNDKIGEQKNRNVKRNMIANRDKASAKQQFRI